MMYLTDGVRLYELLARHAHRNYGLAGGDLITATIRDCVTEDTHTLDGWDLARLREV